MKSMKNRKIIFSLMLIVIIAVSTCYDSLSTSFFYELIQTAHSSGSINSKSSDKDSVSIAIISETVKIRSGIYADLLESKDFLQRIEYKSYILSIYAILFKIALFHSFTIFVLIEIICSIYLVGKWIIHYVHKKDGKKNNMVFVYA